MDEPPSSKDNLDISTRVIPPPNSMVRRFKNIWKLLGDCNIPPTGRSLHCRCLLIPQDIQEVV